MSRTTIIAIVMSLIVGTGVGFAIGRNADPFAMGPQPMHGTTSDTDDSESMVHNPDSMNSMTADLGNKDAEFDLRFINEMIAHHEGAIDMAEQAQKNSDRPEIQNLANEIIAAQSKEIDQMNQWKDAWYGDR